MALVTHHIIVIGSSAGGWETLPPILENIPENLPAAIFIVQHFPSDTMGTAFLNHLSKTSILPCAFAIDREPIHPGRVYLAPPDHHLMINKDFVLITKGPRENSFRPSIDTLFRSAAAYHGSAVIGVLLSGLRDDGVEGLSTVSRSGGITVVQDPYNAPFPDMPQNALNRMPIDYTARTIEMGLILSGLVYQPSKSQDGIPEDVLNEAFLAERVLTALDAVEERANGGTGYTCPACGGVLWDVKHTDQVHSYRCHAGHAYTADTLLHLKSQEVEETMWAALRMMEEQKRMLQRFPRLPGEHSSVERRLGENQKYIDMLRNILLNGGNFSNHADNTADVI
ncbi:chemotaxis protein CheB [Inquilinus sp. KBS0705]|nr:chemotaxis protein CheB [Inquilinus sp. KBS0705]